MSVHDKPKTEGDRLEILGKLIEQARELHGEPVPSVTCASCDRHVPLRFAYKCWFCELYFCKSCGEVHFK